MKRALLALVIPLAAACSTSSAPVATPPSSTPSATTTSASVSVSVSVSKTSASPLTKPFGSTFAWDDGLSVTISVPQPYKASDGVTMQDKMSKTFVVMDVVLKNGSQEPKSPMSLFLQGTTGTREAKRIFDHANGIEVEPGAKVLPGREVTWRIAYGVDFGKPFTLQVDYGFDRKGGIYEAAL